MSGNAHIEPAPVLCGPVFNGMTFKWVAAALFMSMFAVGMTASSARATVILLVEGGQLTGAQNVDVDGEFFDVTFVDGTCFALFDGCNEPSDFAFVDSATALLAAQALLDQVFIGVGLDSFGGDPAKTLGCSEALLCRSWIPYGFSFTPNHILAFTFINWGGGQDRRNIYYGL